MVKYLRRDGMREFHKFQLLADVSQQIYLISEKGIVFIDNNKMA